MKQISIIVPVYYGEGFIPDLICQAEQCRKRLEQQDDVELLLVNDAPSAPLQQKWKSDRIHIEIMNTGKNIGIHGTRVRGLKACQGEYVLFLDQDDRIEPDYLSSQLKAMGTADAVVCKATEGGKLFYSEYPVFENIRTKPLLLSGWDPILSTGQVLLRKRSIPDIWTKNILEHNGADDWFLWLCMASENRSFALNDEILYEHVLSDSNTSKDTMSMLRSEQEMLRVIRERALFSDREFGLLLEGFFKRNEKRTQGLEAFKEKVRILDQWLLLKKSSVCCSEVLHHAGIRTIGIYGCGTLGEYLYAELKDTVQILYFIDKNAQKKHGEIPVYPVSDTLPAVDAVMITIISDAEKVKKELTGFLNSKLFILKDWIQELLRTKGCMED